MSRPPNRAHGLRGAVLVETALTVGVILTIFLFAVQVGLLGFLQLTYDAASFVDARLAAVGVTDTSANGHANATSAIFPQVKPAQIVSTVAPAPSPSVPVDYGYNSTNPTTQGNSLQNRHGGASMLLPTQQTSTITKPAFFTLFGKQVGVASQSVDALWLECGIHVNVANGNGGCSPAAVGLGSSAYAGNYFSAGEYAPPYFVGLNHIHHCTDAQPWTTCSAAGSNFLALGSAEFLHGPAGGQAGNWGPTAAAGVGGDINSTTFYLMACHQRAFATVAAALANPLYGTLHDYYDAPNPWAALYYPPFNATNGRMIFYQMYNTDGNGYGHDPTTSSLRGMNDFQYGPNYPISNWVLDFDQNTDQHIGRIYSWDTQVNYGATVGTVGSNPTNPELWCTYP